MSTEEGSRPYRRKRYCPQGHDTFEVGRTSQSHCMTCHRASVRAAQRKYEGTAKGMLTLTRYEAKRRGTRG